MNRDALHFENRINKMKNNGKENASVVKKCERQLRKLKRCK